MVENFYRHMHACVLKAICRISKWIFVNKPGPLPHTLFLLMSKSPLQVDTGLNEVFPHGITVIFLFLWAVIGWKLLYVTLKVSHSRNKGDKWLHTDSRFWFRVILVCYCKLNIQAHCTFNCWEVLQMLNKTIFLNECGPVHFQQVSPCLLCRVRLVHKWPGAMWSGHLRVVPSNKKPGWCLAHNGLMGCCRSKWKEKEICWAVTFPPWCRRMFLWELAVGRVSRGGIYGYGPWMFV